MARNRKNKPANGDDSTATSTGELSTVLGKINKHFGENTVHSGSIIVQPPRIPTGVFILDMALLGGIPTNRISMFVGEKHSGKSTLATMVGASAQQMWPDKSVVLLDIEGTFDPVWARKLGMDPDTLQYSAPPTGEMAVDIAVALIGSKEVSVLIIDSLAALTPMQEVDTSAEDFQVALQARLISKMVRKLNSALLEERRRGHIVTILFVNQFRMQVGKFFGDPRKIPGGKALEYATSVQVIIKNKEQQGKDARDIEVITENEHSFQITKNKLCGGPRAGEFRLVRTLDKELNLNEGAINQGRTLVTYAKKLGYYKGGGAKWVLDFDGICREYRKADDAVLDLSVDKELAWDLRNCMIRNQAHSLGMPEQFIATI